MTTRFLPGPEKLTRSCLLPLVAGQGGDKSIGSKTAARVCVEVVPLHPGRYRRKRYASTHHLPAR
jgi:hypothetical protein